MNCPKCSTQLPDGSKFCGFCGSPIEEEQLTKLIDEPERFPAPFPAENHRMPANVNAVYAERLSPPQHQTGGYVVGDSYYADDRGRAAPQEPQKKKKNRKPLIISIVALVLVAAIVTGAILIINGGKVSEAELKEAKENYLPPAEALQIDLTKADPSNDQIKFKYDDRARITYCIYSVNQKEYEQNYDYDDAARVVTITVDYKKNHILTKEISYDRITKPDTFEVVDGQILRLDNESLTGEKDKPADLATRAATAAPTEAPTLPPTQPPTEAPTPAPTDPPTEAPDSDFKELYLAFLDATDIRYDSGELIYLNDDDIPELVLNTIASAGPSYICYISDGMVHVYETYSTAGFVYSERNGYFATGAMHQGYLAGVIYGFDGSGVNEEHSYSSHDGSYSVDQTSVSEQEYNDILDSYQLDGPSHETSKSSLPDAIRNFG